jgi:ABC-2 type transport system ATP-binding protein
MAITVTDLTKIYGRRMVVDHISFALPAGQTLGLLGPNGAGKSTTMRMLMGLSRPTSGTATILNYDLHTQTKQIQARIGVVFEKPNLFENLSGYQNLAFFCQLHGQPVTLVRPLLERMALWERAHDPVKIYSKGMRQRILILRALVHRPQVLFLDEPCSGLDPVSSRIIRDYLLELKSQGITILLTSHDMEEVDELCDTIGFINHGQLITLAPKQELKAAYGSGLLKVTYQDAAVIREAVLDPKVDLPQLQTWYCENRVVTVHSTEATLGEIFRKLSDLKK